jgi:hypothetical protein
MRFTGLGVVEWAKQSDMSYPEVPMTDTLPEKRRREVFAALVAAQDTGLSIAASRKQVAAEHAITAKVENIEKEGLEAQWPPLDA